MAVAAALRSLRRKFSRWRLLNNRYLFKAAAVLVRPAVSINALMVDWVDHAAHAQWNVELEGQAPKDDKGWREVERHATQLAAAGTLIALGGTDKPIPDGRSYLRGRRTATVD